MSVPLRRRWLRWKGRIPPFLPPLSLFLILVFLVFWVLSLRMRPLVETVAVSEATNLISLTIAQVVDEQLTLSGLGYQDMIQIDSQQEGGLTTLTGQTATINQLRRLIVQELIASLEELDGDELSVPAGTLTGWLFLSGFGPRIQVRVEGVGDVLTQVYSEFESAGINQTLHRMLLDIQVTVYLVIPGEIIPVTVEDTLSLTETILVGSVPNTYFQWSKGES